MSLISCSKCLSVHDRKAKCVSKTAGVKRTISDGDRFRWTRRWQLKRKEIREDRDGHMCQVCIRELHNTKLKYNYEDIQVHHIVPIEEGIDGWQKRLDNEWLISLCRYHHELAEKEFITRKELREIVKQQENKWK